MKGALLGSLLLSATALAQGKPVVIIAPPHFLLGEQPQVQVEIQINGKLDPNSNVRVLASAGTVTDLSHAGKSMVGVFKPPPEMFPQASILAAIAKVDGKTVVAWQALPLFGMGDLPLTGKPKSMLSAKIGPHVFGPVKADKKGRAMVRIKVPPGYAQVVAGTRTIDLGEAPFKKILAIALEEQVAADGVSQTGLHALVVDKYGRPDPLARVFFKAERGRVGPVRPMEPGVFAAAYTSPVDVGSGTDTIHAGIVGDDVSREMLALKLVRGAPRKVSAWVDPANYVSGGTPPMVWVSIQDAAGNPLDANLELSAEAGKFGPPRKMGPGKYAAPFAPPDGFAGKKELKVAATAMSQGGLPVTREVMVGLKPGKPHRLVVDWQPEGAVADGSTALPIEAKVVDAAGNLVPGAAVTAEADSGATEPPRETETGYVIRYLPPVAFEQTSATVRLSAGATKNLQAELPLRMGPAERTLLVGARMGYQTNLASLSAPVAAISVAARMRFISPRVYLGLEVGAAQDGNGITPGRTLQGNTPIDTRLLLPTGSLQLKYRIGGGTFVGSIGAGALFGVVMGEMHIPSGPSRTERLLVVGAEGLLGAGVRLGRSVIGIDARYQHLRADGDLVRGNVGGFLASLRFDFEM